MDEVAEKIIDLLKREEGMTFQLAQLTLDRTKFLLGTELIASKSADEEK